MRAALLGASINLVGADHVLAGSDWPIAGGGAVREALDTAFERLELPNTDRHAIAYANALRLLGLANKSAVPV